MNRECLAQKNEPVLARARWLNALDTHSHILFIIADTTCCKQTPGNTEKYVEDKTLKVLPISKESKGKKWYIYSVYQK